MKSVGRLSGILIFHDDIVESNYGDEQADRNGYGIALPRCFLIILLFVCLLKWLINTVGSHGSRAVVRFSLEEWRLQNKSMRIFNYISSHIELYLLRNCIMQDEYSEMIHSIGFPESKCINLIAFYLWLRFEEKEN